VCFLPSFFANTFGRTDIMLVFHIVKLFYAGWIMHSDIHYTQKLKKNIKKHNMTT